MNIPLAYANQNVADKITQEDLAEMQDKLTEKFSEVLTILGIDQINDPNSVGTAKRVAKMYVQELFVGRYEQMPDITTFPNTDEVDELIVIGPIAINSTCSHHLVPIVGKAWVGYLPGDNLLGLSKFHRIAHHVFRRPQIQEQATMQLARLLNLQIEPRAIGVVVKAQHFCCSCRGVEDAGTIMSTQVMLGDMQNPALKSEFLMAIKD